MSSRLIDGQSDRADTPFSVVVSECLLFGMVIALIPCYVQIFPLIGVFADLRKATVSFVISIHPHGTTRPPTKGIFVKRILVFVENMSRKFEFQ